MKLVKLFSCGALFLLGCAHTVELSPRVSNAPEVAWLGIDYTHTKMVGVDAFREPDKIFPDYLKKWNALFVDEVLGDLTNKLGKPVVADISAMLTHNEQAQASQIIEDVTPPAFELTAEDVAGVVRGYELERTSGVGLVFIVEAMLKHNQQGCLHATFFDIRTREVLQSKRGCYEALGFGFRNYWFNPVKEAVANF